MTMGSSKYDFSELRGKIRAKRMKEADFAHAIGRSPQFISSVFNGKAKFDIDDIYNTSVVLEVPREEIGSLFCTLEVRN